MKEIKSITYLGLAVCMLVYAMPRLEIGQGMTLPSVFSVIWMAFALLVIAANLYYLLGVDKEKKAEIARVQRFRKWQWEQTLRGRSKMLQVKK